MLGSHGGAQRISRTQDSNPPTAEDHATTNRTGPDRDSDDTGSKRKAYNPRRLLQHDDYEPQHPRR